MLSVIGGAWVLSGSAPVAAQATASAERSFDPATVAPGGSVTVTITAADYGVAGAVIETLPDGFEYVSSDAERATDEGQIVTFILFEKSTFTYVVTASSTEADYTFSGTLRDSDQGKVRSAVKPW